VSESKRPDGDDDVVARTVGATGGFSAGVLGGTDLRSPFPEQPDLSRPRSGWRVVAPLLLVLAAGVGVVVWGSLG